MTGRIKVTELMLKEDLRGEVIKLSPSWRTGIIHGDDGYDVMFSENSLMAGFSYRELYLGLCVSYGFFLATGAKIPTAVDLVRAHAHKTTGSAECSNRNG